MNMQTRERIARTAAWAAAGFGLALAASANAGGVGLQSVRPQAEPLRAPVSIKPTLRKPMRSATIRRHISCSSRRPVVNAMWADRVHLTNDGPTAIPPGTAVYWYMRNDHRIWGAHRLAGGLARGASADTNTSMPTGAGLPCTVVFHRLAWMIPHPAAPGTAMGHAHPGFAPPGGTRKPGIQAKQQHSYALTCKVMGSIHAGMQEPYYYADVANSGPWIVPEGAVVEVRVDGTFNSRQKLTAPLRKGQHFGVSPVIAPSATSHTCSARIY